MWHSLDSYQASIERDAESERLLPPRLRALEAEQHALQQLIDKRAQLEVRTVKHVSI